jgi:hypothetical protein
MDENRLNDVINTIKNSSIEMYAFLSKDKDDNWTVTRQVYSMSADDLSVNERISKIEHTIANEIVIPNLDNYEPGQKVYGKLLQDNRYYLTGVFVDSNNYDI